jgi:hypothetical protein
MDALVTAWSLCCQISNHYSEAIEVAVGALVRSSKFDYEFIYHA